MANGTVIVDPASFTSLVLMSSMPREKFGEPGVQETRADGTPKWTVELAAGFPPPAPGMKASTEIISVTIASHGDPAEGIPAPCPASLTALRMGVSTPELKNGRVVGGRPFWMAEAVTATAAATYRSKDAA